MTTIEVKTQRIVVNPPSGRIDVYGYGPQGPAGPTGPPGPAGPIGWPIVAPLTADGHIQFTPDNTNIRGLRSATDVNSYMKFGAGPPPYLHLKSNSGSVAGNMGAIYLDGDTVSIRNSSGASNFAVFAAGGSTISTVLNTTAINASGNITVPTNSSVAFQNVAGTAWFRPTDGSGNMHLKAVAGAGMYRDADAHYWRNAAGTNLMYINSNILYAPGLNFSVSGYVASTGASVYSKSWFTFQDDQDSGLVFVADGTWDIRANNVILARMNTNGFNIIGGGGISMNDRTIWFRTYGDTSHRMYYQNSGSADPWCEGPVVIGWTGFAYHNASSGVWRWGWRESNTYFWIRNNLLVGSAPDDAKITHTLRVEGNVRVSTSIQCFSGFEATGSMITSTKTAGGWYYDHSFYANPATGSGGYAIHPGGVAGGIRMANGNPAYHFGNVDSGGYYVCWSAGWNTSSTAASKQDIKKFASDERITERLKKLEVKSYRRNADQLLMEVPFDPEEERTFIKSHKEARAKGLEPPKLPKHVCKKKTCGHTETDPCVWIKNWERGQIGLVAEEVELVFPEIVVLDENGNPAGISQDSAVAVLLSAVQELTERIAELERQVA